MAARRANEIRTRGITILQSGHPEIRRLRRAAHIPSIHGNKVWSSSYVVMDYLRRHRPPAGSHHMDIGCGWGVLAVYSAKQLGLEVTAVDADPDVFPYVALHAELNDVAITPLQARFERITGKQLAGVHTLTGTDVCFWDELTPVLFNLIRRALRAGVQQVIIADPGRAPFYALAERCIDRLGESVDVRLDEYRTAYPQPANADLLIIEQP